MTDLIERIEVEDAGGLLPAREPTEPGPTESGRWEPAHTEADTTPRDVARRAWSPGPGPVGLAVLLGCSALLLFLTAAPRFSSWRVGAIAFVVAAWVQVAFGVVVVVRQRRSLCLWVAAANTAICGLWIAALTGHHVSTNFAGGTGVALSIAAVLVALGLTVRPLLGMGWQSSTLALGSIVPVAVVVVTTTALALPPTATAAGSSPPSKRSGATPANPFFSSQKVPGSGSSRFLQIASGNDTEKSELQPWVPLSPSDQAVLDKQLFLAEEAAFRYPTVADAKKAGLILAGGMAPGVGAHYQIVNADVLKGINPDTTVNPAYPGSWIYASTADNAPVVGVMYEAFTKDAPIGFAGPNDHWHQHTNLCITYGVQNGAVKIGVPFAPDTSVTPQQCATVHGQFMKRTLWMVHAWVVPGWESPLGPFSHSNPHLYCPGNTDLTDTIGFCSRQQ